MSATISHVEGSVTLTVDTTATALTAATVLNATSLPVTAGTGTNFKAGQLLLVDAGANAEIVKITATAANTITVTACTKAHASGAACVLVLTSGPGAGPVSPWLSGG